MPIQYMMDICYARNEIMTTIYKIYYTEDGICKSIEEFKLSIALKVTEDLRAHRRECPGHKITHITMVSEDSNMVGEQGVAAVKD